MDSNADKNVGVGESVCVNENVDDSGNLRWFMIIVSNVSLYGQFLDKAIVDNRIRTISYTLNSDQTVSAILPHFWDTAYMDPQFSVLLGDKNTGDCGAVKSGGSKVNKKLIAIIIPVVVGSILLVELGIVLAQKYVKKKRKEKKKKEEVKDR